MDVSIQAIFFKALSPEEMWNHLVWPAGHDISYSHPNFGLPNLITE